MTVSYTHLDVYKRQAEEFISDEEIRETLAYADANKDNVALIWAEGVMRTFTSNPNLVSWLVISAAL